MKNKQFIAVAAQELVATVSMPYEEFQVLNIGTSKFVEKFLDKHPEYAGCNSSWKVKNNTIQFSFFSCGNLVFNEMN